MTVYGKNSHKKPHELVKMRQAAMLREAEINVINMTATRSRNKRVKHDWRKFSIDSNFKLQLINLGFSNDINVQLDSNLMS